MLTAADLAAYEPQWTEPLRTDVSRLRRLTAIRRRRAAASKC